MHVSLIGLAATLALAAPAAAAPDTTPPAVPTLDLPTPGEYVNTGTPLLLWGSATDDVGVVSYGLVLDGAYLGDIDAGDCSTTCSVELDPAIPDGAHTWAIVAWDDAENSSQSATSTFTVDTVAPAMPTITSPSWQPNKATVTWTGDTDRYLVKRIGTSGTSGYFDTGSSSAPVTIPNGAEAQDWSVVAVDEAGNHSAEARQTLHLSHLGLQVKGPWAANFGETVTFTALPAGADRQGALTYDWDLDGDSVFEITGTGPTATARLTSLTPPPVHARVRPADGTSAIGTANAIKVTPPTGKASLSINAGALFANRRVVTLSLTWPSDVTTVTLLSPGGAPATMARRSHPRWTLTGSGTDRKADTVSAVLLGAAGPYPTVSDSILLDLEKPKVKTAVLRGGKVRTTVIEKVSGVASIQLAARRAKPAKALPYSKAVKAGRTTRYVRVTDRAGNVSAWKAVKHV